MKRDPRLHGLSSDHHHALVLVRRIREALTHGEPSAEFVNDIGPRLESQLEPHFTTEEEILVSELRVQGEQDLAERTLLEHRALRSLLAEVRSGWSPALASLADTLEAHVRFEERELFPRCEAVLPQHVLDALVRRAKK